MHKLKFYLGGKITRKCLRCGIEMKENCTIKVEGGGYGIVMSTNENKLFCGRIGKPY